VRDLGRNPGIRSRGGEARRSGLKPEQIRLHSHLIGGGFGRRLEVDGIVLAARIARHVQGPVRVL